MPILLKIIVNATMLKMPMKFLLFGLATLLAPIAVLAQSTASCSPNPSLDTPCTWPRYERFIKDNVQADGRVIDYGPPQQTTSEGQSYAMFFALVNNDRAQFDRLLNWTQNNLANGDLSRHLPAWQWGKRADERYGVLDANSAADADLWIAYDLAEAGRLWKEARYVKMAQAVLAEIEAKEVFALPGFGPMLAPGQEGFRLKDDVWRLNPSYMPLPLLRVAAALSPAGPWEQIAVNTVTLLQAVSPKGLTPDWVAYRSGEGFVTDPAKGDIGSYDAIRVYLWAGLTSSADPAYQRVLDALTGMSAAVVRTGNVPESVHSLSGDTADKGPVGFMAALLPYLSALKNTSGYDGLLEQVSALNAPQLNYYNAVLTLFGEGAVQGRYRFNAQGQLMPRWAEH